MTAPLKLSLLLEANATSLKAEAAASAAAIKGIGAAGAQASPALSALAKAEQEAAAAAQKVRDLYSGQGSGAQQAAKNMALARHEVTNLSAQLSDLGVQLAGGGSPFMAMIQQGPQIAQVLGGRGLTGIIMGVGQGIASLVNPVTLVMAGITAAGYAASYVFDAMQEDVIDTDEVLKNHEANIKRLKEAWDSLPASVQAYRAEAPNVAEFRLRAGQEPNRAAWRTEAEKSLTEFYTAGAGMFTTGGVEGVEPFLGAIAKFRQSMTDGTPEVQAFRQAVLAVADTDPTNKGLQETAAKLVELTDKAAQLEGAARGAEGALKAALGVKTSEGQYQRPALRGIVGADVQEQRARDQALADRSAAALQDGGARPNAIEQIDLAAEAREKASRTEDRAADRREKRAADYLQTQEASNQLARVELVYAGQSGLARERAVAAAKVELDILKMGVGVHSQIADKMREQAREAAPLHKTRERCRLGRHLRFGEGVCRL